MHVYRNFIHNYKENGNNQSIYRGIKGLESTGYPRGQDPDSELETKAD